MSDHDDVLRELTNWRDYEFACGQEPHAALTNAVDEIERLREEQAALLRTVDRANAVCKRLQDKLDKIAALLEADDACGFVTRILTSDPPQPHPCDCGLQVILEADDA